jgi:hypothetical protein
MSHIRLLASDPVNDVFGKITPAPGMNTFGDNPVAGLSNLIVKGIQLFILVAGLFMLFFLLWGALDWIISSGDKEKIQKAQTKISNAIIGFIVLFVVLAGFGVVTGDILGIVKKTSDGGWYFTLPTLGDTTP